MLAINGQLDDLILKDPRQAIQASESVSQCFELQDCKFGKNVLPTFLKPAFLSFHEEKHLKNTVKHLTSMLEKTIGAYFKYPELRPIYGVKKEDKKFIELDPGYSQNIVVSRPDALVEKGVYRFIEFNCDSPAGAGYADIQESIFKKEWPLSYLSKRYNWGPARRIKLLLKSILKCYREFGGRRSHPNIAIIDWRTVRTQPEFRIFKKYFISQGYNTVIGDPRDLRLKGNKLYLKDLRIDLIYRRVIISELLSRKNEVKDLLKAYAARKVCMVNSLRSKLAASKSTLSILTNPAYNYLFSEEEIKARDHHVPWTRLVVDAKKFYGGKSIYLTELIDEHQNDLVLKPASGYGGRDVRIGKETSKRIWRQTIKTAIRGGEHWVVQEYVDIPKIKMPIVSKNKVSLRYKNINMNPYVFGGQYAGALARLSDASVINVSRGGGLIPSVTFKRR